MKEQEIKHYCRDEIPVIYHKKQYYIVGINVLNKTVTLKRASVIGLVLSGRMINNVSFNDLEI